MKKYISYIIRILILLLCMQIVISPISNASSISDIIQGADSFLSEGKSGEDIIDYNAMKDAKDTLYNTLFAIGVVVSVIVGAILGIKFMTASVEGKADIKEKLIIYVVGCIVVFGAFFIWKIAVQIFSQIS